MRFDIITIFPEFFRGPLDYGIVRRAREAALIDVAVHDLRAFTHDRHNTVDDRPFGGGEGMVMKPEPIFEAVESLVPRAAPSAPAESQRGGGAIVLLSASGRMFRQEMARQWARAERVVLICGRYEGVDERVAEHLATDEISIGDFVLSGGELAAALVLDAVTRLLPGALGNEASAIRESFSEPEPTAGATPSADAPVILPDASRPATIAPGLLDCPHYTRPAEFRGWQVPDVLVGGNHVEIRVWRRKMGLRKTLRNRPDLLAGAPLSAEDRRLIQELRSET
ncbi:MAG: tRNA (guanosine(37)-N1)-methyltransferase TrmD [Candidatus Acidiferrales bacterium]